MDFFKPLSAYIQDPVQVSKEQQQQNALIEALRGVGGTQQSAVPSQVGNVVSANSGTGAFQSGVGLGNLFGQLGKKYMASLGQPASTPAPNVSPQGFDTGV